MLDETYVMNQVKEDCCYVSLDFANDLEIASKKKRHNTIARDYILPDYTNVKRGFIRPLEEMWTKYEGTEQLLRISNERFAVPELLFHPSDIGIPQMGIPEAVVDAISVAPRPMQPHFYMNIVLTGGNALFEGFSKRLYQEIRAISPVDFEVNIKTPDNPTTYAWQGGVALSQHENFIKNFCVTKKEYEESGRSVCSLKFEGGVPS